MSDRYSRQTRFAPWGEEGQSRLRQRRVTVVGCGALGTANAELLARAGVGALHIVDRDVVEWSNLQRQCLFQEDDAVRSRAKAEAAAERLQAINSEVSLSFAAEHLDHRSADEHLAHADLIVDGTDNFETRLLLNDVAVRDGKPWVYGGCVGSTGIAAFFEPTRTPCLQCLFPADASSDQGETCESVGILGPVVQTVAAWQSMEALKWLTGNGSALSGTLLRFDLWESRWQQVAMGAGEDYPDCSCCKGRTFAHLRGAERTMTTSLCGRNAVQVVPARRRSLDLAGLARAEDTAVETLNASVLRLRLSDAEVMSLFADGRAIIHGTDDTARARALYDRHVPQ